MHPPLSHRALAVLVALVLVAFAACDTYTRVQGTVIDNMGKPVDGAAVRLTLINTGRTARMTTGPDGKFSLELQNARFSLFELVASMPGYEDYRQQIPAKTSKTIQIALTPQKR